MILKSLSYILLLLNYSLIASIPDTGQTVTVPVVIHVLYNASDQNISDDQIRSQIEVLNEDFRRTNTDASNTPSSFLSVAADCNIEFTLANYTPTNVVTSGIEKHATTNAQFFNDNVMETSKGGADSWGTTYLNIWVANLPDGVVGWSNGITSDSLFQGVVIDFEAFGTSGTAKSPTNLGRTLTHEVGHWLGLEHLEGSGGCSVDDGIDDTPLQEIKISGSVTSNTSCGSLDMTSNFMQLVDDNMMNLFTLGQKEKMRLTLFNDLQPLLQNVSKTVGLKNYVHVSFESYPNPIKKSVIYFNEAVSTDSEMYLYNSKGEALKNMIYKESKSSIRLDDKLKTGVYFLRYSDGKYMYQTKINLVN